MKPAHDSGCESDLKQIRYGSSWKDSEVLLEALQIREGDRCVAIASGGENVLAMLARAPGRVIALDLNPAQLSLVALKAAAFRSLSHPEMLRLVGVAECRSSERAALYARCRGELPPKAREHWDASPRLIAAGLYYAGRFERKLRMIRRFILPHLHAPETYTALFAERDRAGREVFYSQVWDTPRWRHGCRILFSRRMLAWLGAGREVLRETDGDVSERLTEHVRHLLVDLAPAENPFLQWIQRGEHGSVLPYALRPENFEQIRTYLDRLELHCATLEAWLEREPVGSVDRFSLNHLSDSMDRSGFERVLRWIGHVARGGTRLVHWNLLARTPVPKALSDRIEPMQEVEETLGAQDKSVFHTALSVWRVR